MNKTELKNNYFSIILITVGILTALILFVKWNAGEDAGEKELTILEKISTLEFSDYMGQTRTLSEYQGTPLVVNAWAAWCPFCKKELPDFAFVQEEFDGAVVMIAIDRAESLSVAKEYTDSIGISDKLVFLLDPNDTFYKAIGGFSMPETLFFDAQGNLVEHKRGPLEREEIRKRVQNLVDVSESL